MFTADLPIVVDHNFSDLVLLERGMHVTGVPFQLYGCSKQTLSAIICIIHLYLSEALVSPFTQIMACTKGRFYFKESYDARLMAMHQCLVHRASTLAAPI